jgi:hypothetical protein
MKRFKSLFLALILALALCVGLAGCGGAPATPTYKLTFEMNGHGTQIASQSLGVEDVPTTPANPSEEGWRFDGWFTDNTYSVYFNFNNRINRSKSIVTIP